MMNHRLGQDYLKQASERNGFPDTSFHKGSWAIVVRVSQEIVELSLKGALRVVGIEPPKFHDVGKILSEQQAKFPSWFRKEIPYCSKASFGLQQDRELSFYGDTDKNIPASELFSKEEAQTAREQATHILELCERLIGEYDANESSSNPTEPKENQ